MCLMVYLGSNSPFAMGPPAMDGDVAPASLGGPPPPALRDRAHVAMLVDWHGGKPGCSCVFSEHSLPWEPRREEPETVVAFEVLRSLSEKHGRDFVIYGCEHDDSDDLPNVRCRIAPAHIRAGMILFNIPFQGGEKPRTLVEIDPDLDVPDKPETLGVL